MNNGEIYNEPILLPGKPGDNIVSPGYSKKGRTKKILTDKEKKMKNILNRDWIFTWNKWKKIGLGPLHDLLNLKIIIEKKWTYFIGKPEIGKNGTDHIQGLLQTNYTSKYSLLQILNKIDNIDLHPVNFGDTDNVKNYSIKEETKDGEPFEIGTYEYRKHGQGTRTDIDEFKEDIKNENTKLYMYEHHFENMSRHEKAYFGYKSCLQKEIMLNKMRDCIINGKDNGIKVFVYYGNADYGKSFAALQELCKQQRFYWCNFGHEPITYFHDYEWERYAFFDDFYGNIKYNLFLDITDPTRKVFRLRQLYGFIYPVWDVLIITSNDPPWEWYSCMNPGAMIKRIKNVIKFSKENNEYKQYKHTQEELIEYFNAPPKQKHKKALINYDGRINIINKNDNLNKIADMIKDHNKRTLEKTISELAHSELIDNFMKRKKLIDKNI